MVDPALPFMLFDKALEAVGLIPDKKQKRTERTDQALLALLAALAETRPYISELENGKPRNREKEVAIARLWNTASVPLRVIDIGLAERCFEKGGYWMEPDAWDPERIEATGIAIESMYEATRQLLLTR
jgi:hypothetical protein